MDFLYLSNDNVYRYYSLYSMRTCVLLFVRSAVQIHDRIRGHDIKLLKHLNIHHICDLMLETKKVKYFMKWVGAVS